MSCRSPHCSPHCSPHTTVCNKLLSFQEMRTELATLAHHCCDIDKYRVETCCIIGEYFQIESTQKYKVLTEIFNEYSVFPSIFS